MNIVRNKISNNRGQTATEFLFIIILVISVIMIHAQFSLSYVVASYVRYASFMAARAEAVSPGSGDLYIEDLLGDSTRSKLHPIATISTPPGGSYVVTSAAGQGPAGRGPTERIDIPYNVLIFVPMFERLAEGLTSRTTSTTIKREPINILRGTPGYAYDN